MNRHHLNWLGRVFDRIQQILHDGRGRSPASAVNQPDGSTSRPHAIVLTMDTYGHLFPGQEAETISRLPKMMAVSAKAAKRA